MCLYNNNNNNTQIMPSSIRRRRYKYKYKNEDTDDEEDVDDGSAVDEMSLIRVMNNHIYFYEDNEGEMNRPQRYDGSFSIIFLTLMTSRT